MSINPLTNSITSLELMETKLPQSTTETQSEVSVGQPTFLDIFKDIVTDAAETQAQKNQDMLDIMLGDTDNLEEIQANIAKAEIALDLMVSVKNTVVESYNEIIKMSI